ncbi:MAG: hypothetical protein K2K55_09050 [Duncaniella sp.]|nr:hypothetical protein [Duncaniella sp.]
MNTPSIKIYRGQIVRSLFIFLTLLLTSCSDDDPHFTVRLRVDGLGNQGVDMVYTDRRGALRRVTAHPDSKEIIEFTGSAPSPTLAEFFTAGSARPLLALPVEDGRKIEARMKFGLDSTLVVKGWKPAAEFVRLLASTDSVADPIERNSRIAAIVGDHPKDFLSAFLLMTRFHVPGHELEADSLLQLIDQEILPQGMVKNWARMLGGQIATGAREEMRGVSLPISADTLRRASLTPGLQSYQLLAVTAKAKNRDDILTLRSLRDSFPNNRLDLLEVGAQTDSATWRADIARDTAGWQQGWAPGGVSSAPLRRLEIPRLPFYIVADSSTKIIYRGESLDEAAAVIRSRLVPAADTDSLANEVQE